MFNQHYREGMVREQADIEEVLEETMAAIRMNLVKRIWEEGRKEAEDPPELKEDEIIHLLRLEPYGVKMDGDRFCMEVCEEKERKKEKADEKKENIFLYKDEIKMDTEGKVVLQTVVQGRKTIWSKVDEIPIVTKHGVSKKELERIQEATQRRVRSTDGIMKTVGDPTINNLLLEERLRNLYGDYPGGRRLRPVYRVRTVVQQMRAGGTSEDEMSEEYWRLRYKETDKKEVEGLVQKVLGERGFTDGQNADRVHTMAEHIAYSEKIDMKQHERLALIVQMYEWIMDTPWKTYHRDLEANTTKKMEEFVHITVFPTVARTKRRMPGDSLRRFGDEQANSDREGEYALATARSVKILSQRKEMCEQDAIEQLWLLIRGGPREQMRIDLGLKTSHSESLKYSGYKYDEIVDAFLNRHIKHNVAEAHKAIIKSRKDKETLWEDYVAFLRGMAGYALFLDDERRDREKLVKMTILLQLNHEQRKMVKQHKKVGGNRHFNKQSWEIAKILDKEETEMSPYGTVAVTSEDDMLVEPDDYRPIVAKVQTYQRKWIGFQQVLSNQIVRGRQMIQPRWTDHVVFYSEEENEDTTTKATVSPDWTVPMTLYNGTRKTIIIRRNQEIAHVMVEPQNRRGERGTFDVMSVWKRDKKERDERCQAIEHQQELIRYRAYQNRQKRRKAMSKPAPPPIVVQSKNLHPDVIIEPEVREELEEQISSEQSGGPRSPETHQIGFLDDTRDEEDPDSWQEFTPPREDSGTSVEEEVGLDVVDTEPFEEVKRKRSRKRNKHGRTWNDIDTKKVLNETGRKRCRDCENCGKEFCQKAHDEGWRVHRKACGPEADREKQSRKEVEESLGIPNSRVPKPIIWANDQ